MWHFTFTTLKMTLPERLVQGHERTCLRHFLDQLNANPWGISLGGPDEGVYVELNPVLGRSERRSIRIGHSKRMLGKIGS